jgi:hypothetical protein
LNDARRIAPEIQVRIDAIRTEVFLFVLSGFHLANGFHSDAP